MQPSPAFRCTCSSDFSQWWALLLGWCSRRHGSTTYSPLFHQLHWLRAREQIDFKVDKCQHGVAPSYLADEPSQPADLEARRRLCSTSSPSLAVPTIGDRACLSLLLAFEIVCRVMSQHCLSSTADWRHTSLGAATRDCAHDNYSCAWEVILLLSDTLIILVTYLHTVNDQRW